MLKIFILMNYLFLRFIQASKEIGTDNAHGVSNMSIKMDFGEDKTIYESKNVRLKLDKIRGYLGISFSVIVDIEIEDEKDFKKQLDSICERFKEELGPFKVGSAYSDKSISFKFFTTTADNLFNNLPYFLKCLFNTNVELWKSGIIADITRKKVKEKEGISSSEESRSLLQDISSIGAKITFTISSRDITCEVTEYIYNVICETGLLGPNPPMFLSAELISISKNPTE